MSWVCSSSWDFCKVQNLPEPKRRQTGHRLSHWLAATDVKVKGKRRWTSAATTPARELSGWRKWPGSPKCRWRRYSKLCNCLLAPVITDGLSPVLVSSAECGERASEPVLTTDSFVRWLFPLRDGKRVAGSDWPLPLAFLRAGSLSCRHTADNPKASARYE